MGKRMNPNSLAALEANKFKKGKKPTGGRPPGALSLKSRLDRYIDLDIKVEMPCGTITDASVMDAIVLALITKARTGDVHAIREILDRYYGKLTDKMELTGKDGESISTTVYSERLSEAYKRAEEAFNSTARADNAGLAQE